MKYFGKNWAQCNFLNFDNLNKEQIRERTDNYSENFNRNLNQLIGRAHPKISFLVEKLKEYTIKQYNQLIESKMLRTEKFSQGFNIYNDIFNFVLKIKEKTTKNLCIKTLKELETPEIINIKNFTLTLIKELFNVEPIEESNNNDNITIILDNDLGEDYEKIEKANEDLDNISVDGNGKNKLFNNQTIKNTNENFNKDDKLEEENLFDVETKNYKKNKNFEFTDFYMINEDLFYKKTMKIKKLK